ncbi:integrase arm-type DNA-binding domain-containing protein [Rhizobium sp. TRM96647]|uniref:tyrosine-type recombinase/integrase n=1 Tax=unclassified Rhizobium TaxID=2613769 RepID=UPI0021E76768|nr:MULTISPECIES: site-specific integrase [unclassified Rhizobium]MCV3734996.1 integrase arm-type DNA-binding domain-containing protein [Rhizobium sp. TRM96647]MCV3757366.1 integrase arm-type DNA-binding domain-containing protein [Rhizobium sp. TRM96650]
MARTLNKLTDVFIKSPRLKAGRHSDGGGLYLNVTPNGAKSWLFMWTRDGKRREMGAGAYPEVALSKARTRAAEYREAVADGRDPIAERAREAEPTFADCVDRFLESMEQQWRNEKHRAQWRTTLTTYCVPLASKKVSDIGTEDVLKALKPIWTTKSETASRLRGRIERVLDFAKVKGWRSGENPALWRGHLKSILPARQKLTRGHHAAMEFDSVPAFVAKLRKSEAMAARALEFLILTAARSGEVLGAVWDEIDLEAKIWTVPKERMKAGREHRVPLPQAAVDILTPLHEVRTGALVFPGQKKDRPLSGMAMAMLMRRLKFDAYTVHGFRSAFRDWAGDRTTFPREVAEAALAHAVGDATEQAYRRSDALAKRRKLMEAWAKSLATSKGAGNVLQFGGR